MLELACGPGGVGIEAAALVQPGEVVLSDVAPEMMAIAAARAVERGLANVSTCELDLEQIERADASFDVVLCRDGLMFAADPGRAAARDRARAAARTAASRSPCGDRASATRGSASSSRPSARSSASPCRRPASPAPSRSTTPARLAGLMTAAGLADVVVDEVDVPMRAATFDEWWTRTSALAGPLAKRLESLPDQAVLAAARPARGGGAVRTRRPSGLEFPGVTLIASGRRTAP